MGTVGTRIRSLSRRLDELDARIAKLKAERAEVRLGFTALIADLDFPALTTDAASSADAAPSAGDASQPNAVVGTWCPQCGPDVAVFEDGCALCGTTAMGEGVNEALAQRRHLHNLLARIHRDGGHYTEKVGLDQAVADADIKVATAYVLLDERAAEDKARSE